MSSISHPALAARSHWRLATMYAFVAVLPQLLLLGTQIGIVPQAYAVFFGANAALPPLFLGGAEVNPLVWAWAIFFGVMAFMTAADHRLDTRTKTAPSDDGGDDLSGGLDMPMTEAVYGRGSEPPRYEPRINDGDNLPAVDMDAAGAAFGEGSRLHGLGRYQDAIRSFERAIELNPRSTAAWHSKGSSQCAAGLYEEGIRSFNEALLLDRQNARLWHDKGNALAKLGRQGDAIRCFNKAHEIDSSYAPIQQ